LAEGRIPPLARLGILTVNDLAAKLIAGENQHSYLPVPERGTATCCWRDLSFHDWVVCRGRLL
jgi:hypothetical protein